MTATLQPTSHDELAGRIVDEHTAVHLVHEPSNPLLLRTAWMSADAGGTEVEISLSGQLLVVYVTRGETSEQFHLSGGAIGCAALTAFEALHPETGPRR